MSQEKLYEQIHEAFNYKDGNLYWKIPRKNMVWENKPIKKASLNIYLSCILNNKS